MALLLLIPLRVHCRACGKDIDAAGDTCPSCGQPIKGGFLGRPGTERALNIGCLIIILAMIVLLLVVLATGTSLV